MLPGNGKNTKTKNIEQSRVPEGSPTDGVGSMVGRISGKGSLSLEFKVKKE